jgi:hypothetical protein
MTIISLSGKAECGKNLAGELLKIKLEEKNKSCILLAYADLLKYLAQKYFGWNGIKDEVGRNLLQQIGTDKFRKSSPTFFVDFIIKLVDVIKNDFDYAIITDCRFVNEIQQWKKNQYNIISVHIERLNYTNQLTKEQQNHPSETKLDYYEFDYYIKSNTGKENMEKEIDKLLIYLGE